jgi:ribosomal protein L15E
MKSISIGDIDATICKLRPLEHDDKADDLITQCVTEPSFTHEFFNIDALHNFSRPRDEKFIKAIRKRYQELKPKKSLREDLEENAENALSSEGMKALQEASAEAYYDVFKTENGPHLGRWIEKALQYPYTAEDGITHVRNNVEKALQKIAGESKLNEMRIEKFNIPQSKDGNL